MSISEIRRETNLNQKRLLNALRITCCCAFIVGLASGQAAAARRSRALPIVLFASGLGLQFGGSLLKTSAQNRYDEYLNAAIQSDIQAHRDAYRARRNGSVIMSRVGYGCIGLAVLLSIYGQLDTPDEPVSPQANRIFGGTGLAQPQYEWETGLFALRRARTTGVLQPQYEWETGRASLRLLHYF